MAGKKIDFYWEIGSTNSYFAWHLIKPIAICHGAELVLHPVNLGFVFRHHRVCQFIRRQGAKNSQRHFSPNALNCGQQAEPIAF